MTGGPPPGTRRTSAIGAGNLAAGLVGDITAAVADAMDEARLEIAAATTELVSEIRDGGKQVARAVLALGFRTMRRA